MRRICNALQQKVINKYPAEQIEIVKYTAISGFLFLRFFCPAVLGPKLFDLMKEHPEMKTARYLVLFFLLSSIFIFLLIFSTSRLSSQNPSKI